MVTDQEMLKMLEDRVKERGKDSLYYDDEPLLNALRITDVKECPVCHSSVKHSISSVCAGHGEFPRYLKIKCQGCGISSERCVDFGGSILDAIDAFKRKAERIIKAVKGDA